MPRASRLITGKFVVYRNDGTDAGNDPDEIPVVGLVVQMTPATQRVRETTVPQTAFLETYWGVTGSDGVLKDSTGTAGIKVPVSVPENFTYRVRIIPPDGSNQAPFEFDWIVPAGSSGLDITTAIPVPANPGAANLDDWLAVVGQIETLRNETVTAKNAAETAKTAAETARTGAQTAQTGAQTARTGAQTAQTAAEAARDAATANLGLIQDAVTRAPSLIFNGGFELGSGQSVATGWTYTGDVARDTATATYKGVASLFFGTGAGEAISDAVPATAGRTIRLAAMHRSAASPAVTGGLRIQSSVDGVTWTQIGTAPPALVNSTTWTESAIRREVPAGANWIRARIAFAPGGAAVRFDEVSMTDITPLVEAEAAAASANTAYNNSIVNAVTEGDRIRFTRGSGATYLSDVITIPGPQGPTGKVNGNSDNLVRDPNLANALADNWVATVAGVDPYISKVSVTGAPGNAIRISGPGVRVKNLNQIPVIPGETFWLGALIQRATGSAGKAYLSIIERDATGGHRGARYVEIPVQGWSYTGGYAPVLTGSHTTYVEFELATDANFTGQIWYTGIEMRSVLRPTEVQSSTVKALENRSGRDAIFVGSSNVLSGGWPTLISDAMGWTARHFAVGGTGFTQGDNGTPTGPNTFLKQLQAAATSTSIVNTEVGQVFIADAGNDIRSVTTSPNIGAAAVTAIDYAKAQFPNARIYIVPVLWGPHNWNNDPLQWDKLSDVVGILRDAAVAAKVDFLEDSWIWHHNDVNSMISGEVHYTARGHGIIADRVAQYMRSGSSQPIRQWNLVGPANANITVGRVGGNDYRGLSVRREGAVVNLNGAMVNSAAQTGSTGVWAVVPSGFRPTYVQEVQARVGSVMVPCNIAPSGNLTVIGTTPAGATITFGSSYRID